ncbi:hypothetical protein K1719_030780 [Acacia pycnantha]|nr:hypothetical protein K1719_030780 [Acacia pycnantha]
MRLKLSLRPYVFSLPDGSGTANGKNWKGQGLDHNAGPGGPEMEEDPTQGIIMTYVKFLNFAMFNQWGKLNRPDSIDASDEYHSQELSIALDHREYSPSRDSKMKCLVM